MDVEVVVGLVGGAALASLLWVGLKEVFAAEAFARRNVRGVDVPVAVGVIIPVTAVALAAVDVSLLRLDLTDRAYVGWGTVPLAALGFGLLGLLDDLGGTGDARGFRGHLAALARGRLTTGGLKLLGGGLLAALLVAGAHPDEGVAWFVVDVALVALAANLGNLLDRAPGRCTKVALLTGVAVLVAAGGDVGGLAVILGAAAGLLVPDLRERLMLGDTGANALGGAIGVGVVATVGSTTTRAVVAVVLLALNLASERVSFSQVIHRVGPLRWLDDLGRR